MDITSLLPLITPMLPGVPDNLMLQRLKLAARQFCLDSGIWRADLESIDFEDDTTDYTLDVGDLEAIVHRVNLITLDTERQVDPTGYEMLDGGVVRFDPVPSDATSFIANVTLIPTVAVTEIPDWMGERWGEAICANAIWKIKTMLQFRDSDGAVISNAEYRDAVGKARLQLGTKMKTTNIMWQEPDFF